MNTCLAWVGYGLVSLDPQSTWHFPTSTDRGMWLIYDIITNFVSLNSVYSKYETLYSMQEGLLSDEKRQEVSYNNMFINFLEGYKLTM